MPDDNNTEQTPKKEPEYMGNIWGWRFSAISGALLLIVFLLTLPQQRQYMKDGTQELPSTRSVQDTLQKR